MISIPIPWNLVGNENDHFLCPTSCRPVWVFLHGTALLYITGVMQTQPNVVSKETRCHVSILFLMVGHLEGCVSRKGAGGVAGRQ
jgi:hypothetical protein